jgi:hypothetical protein
MIPVKRWTAVVALCVTLPVVATFAVQDAPKSRRQGGDQPPSPARQADGGPGPGGGEGRRGGMRRELTDKDVDRIIATARDVDPTWADALEAQRKEDPAKLRQRLGMQARATARALSGPRGGLPSAARDPSGDRAASQGARRG